MALDSYILLNAEAEEERLALQHSLIEEETRAHLQSSGLAPGMRVLELGCGTGELTFLIASIIGPNGVIIAIDVDQSQLDILKHRADEQKFTNITTVLINLNEMPPNFITEKVDAVCSRLIFMHLRVPRAVITASASMLKENGIFTSHESIFNTAYSVPNNMVMKEIIDLITMVGEQKSVDYNIGNSLASMFDKSDFTEIQRTTFQKGVSKKNAMLLLLPILAAIQKNATIEIQEQCSRLAQQFEALPDDTIVYLPEQAQVSAKRFSSRI